ncbi:ABC transporter permease subunit [Cellulomonas sp. APG4]|uniref:ABC transporter permease n=1 Tax=Cellulomonas sp. APG4 TaxID=1538656 RepID=UPI00137AE1D7|nr:ABC transporter permease [Cellulomonas sp. APG4]NCT91999.1 ABC transporter permease subunit [Cellulomonas sp. APG4]
MRAALEVEALKLRRSGAARIAALVLLLAVPGAAAGFLAAARMRGDSMLAAKVEGLVIGEGWTALLGLVGQLLSVAVLLAVGVVVAWSFGREHVDGTFGALFALPTARRDVALAKTAVLVAWGLVLSVGAVAVTALLGLTLGLGTPGADAAGAAGRAVVVGVPSVLLALPLGWVAGVGRGYLPAIGALLGLVVVTQVVTVLGAGAWFPWAAPGMWSGMGGAELAATVTPVQLLLAVPVGAVATWATAAWWARAEVR